MSANTTLTVSDDNDNTQFMVYSYFASRPSLSVYTTREKLTAGAGENFIEFTATQNKLKIFMGDTSNFSIGDNIRLSGGHLAGDTNSALLNGREFEIVTTGSSGGEIILRSAHPGCRYLITILRSIRRII